MPRPTNVAAIDAGSNAIRLVIARSGSFSEPQLLESERYALRLGRHVFTQHGFEKETIDKAVKAFRHFRSLMDLHDVKQYRAVATSATREAQNRKQLVDRVYQASGIRLEVIDGAEEARLVRCAVQASIKGKVVPRLIADLGGGSFEISLLKSNVVEESSVLPIGTVRMMETFEIRDAISPAQQNLMSDYVRSLVGRSLPVEEHPANAVAVACGGNADALSLIAPGPPRAGIRTLNLPALRRRLAAITSLDVGGRMRRYHVRKDRAEVMGIAAVVFLALGRWWKVENLLVPGVGVKEGILADLLGTLAGTGHEQEHPEQERGLLSAARQYASRLNWDARHSEDVRRLSVALFDQLQPVHQLDEELRLILELAALLHDVGHVVGRGLHHKHGEYLIRHGQITGLDARRRDMAACVVRYHREVDPEEAHKLFASLPRKAQSQVRALSALLRIADALDSDHKQTVVGVRARIRNRTVRFDLRMKKRSELNLWAASRRAQLFEELFDCETEFHSKAA